ncbi:PDZ domain-containing RING finger protein 4 isoform X2 [Bombus huntii]|uniref:PDZ domain-containing RING finger protein 4 isoform X2 n=1 Tax=Bombus huntii TaxID=85661 RepID=UPI0021AA985B|nr:PDZ domain-containing RING finger protein 4 isoform X2 [Bombus huntii]
MDFVILKVNGQDVSNSSHEDAVRCFQSAQEPIIVEVLRRQPTQQQQQQQHSQRTGWKEQESRSTEPEKEWERTAEGGNKRDQHAINTCSNLVSTAVQTDWAGLLETEEEELLPVVDEQPNDSFEDFLAHDIDFEEVTLRKAGSAEKLGLTVCYSSGSGSEDADTEVYISEIVPESLAARDGRLREGDQILRVNGKDVANKEQTENLFAETKNAVTILVSRCLYQEDDYKERRVYPRGSPLLSPDHLPSYQNSLIEQLIRQQQQQTEERTKDTEEDCSTLRPPPPPPPPVPCHTLGHQANNNTPSSSCSSQTSQKSSGRNAASPARHADHDRKQWMQETLKDCSKKMEGLCVRGQSQTGCGGGGGGGGTIAVRLADAYSNHVWSETEHIYETIPESDSEPIYSSPYEHHRHWHHANHTSSVVATAQPTITTVPLPPTTIVSTIAIAITTTANTTTSNTVIQYSQNQANQSGRWYCSSKSNSSGEEKDSSSAYNTGESCNSNPLTLELQRGERDHHKSTLVLCPPKALAVQQQQQQQQQQQRLGCTCPAFTNRQTRNQSNKRGSSSHYYRDRATDPTNLPADTMYTNMANLQQTMLLQQQLFKQALDRRNSTIGGSRESSSVTAVAAGGTAKKSRSHGNFQAPNLTRYQFVGSQQVCASSSWIPPEDKANDVQMEWKVKRRADGTRYIARRPVRNRILRNRAIKISEERAGHSTEDDTMSEVKVGRYWTKEERKRQLERARERKQRQQELQLQQQQQQQLQQQQQQQQQQLQMQQTNELLTCEHGEHEKLPKKPLNIVELSHKKMARKKNTLDDFTTVQEMLVHGNRIGSAGGPGTGGKLMGLLSVTTV